MIYTHNSYKSFVQSILYPLLARCTHKSQKVIYAHATAFIKVTTEHFTATVILESGFLILENTGMLTSLPQMTGTNCQSYFIFPNPPEHRWQDIPSQ